MRAVLDPSVIAAAAIARSGPPRRLLFEFRGGAFELVTSPRLLAEVEALLARPALRRHVDPAESTALMDVLLDETELFDDPPVLDSPISEDPEDDYLIALARAGSARVVVSADPHLASLADRLPILSPTEFLLVLT